MKDTSKMEKANNYCPHCDRGILPHLNVGFVLKMGDIIEDHVGLRVKIDTVYDKDNTQGWGTTLNGHIVAMDNHSNHRVVTNNDHYKESLWTLISRDNGHLIHVQFDGTINEDKPEQACFITRDDE